MTQKSMLFSSARVRVLEKKLINREDLLKLVDAPSAEEALKFLSDRGYGQTRPETEGTDTLRAMIDAELTDLGELLLELSSDERITNVFLHRSDVTNLKLLIKRKMRDAELDSAELDSCAVIPHALIKSMVKNEMYFDLPDAIMETLGDIHKELRENPPVLTQKTEGEPDAAYDPSFISVELDRAYYKYARSQNNAFLSEYFSAECDFVNLDAFFRIKRLSGSVSDLERAVMPAGSITHENLKAAFLSEDESKVPAILTRGLSGDLLRAVRNSLTAHGTEITPDSIEKARDNYLLSVIKRGKDDMESILPVVGYYMAKRREADAVRMIITLKRNGFSPEFIKQRLRDV